MIYLPFQLKGIYVSSQWPNFHLSSNNTFFLPFSTTSSKVTEYNKISINREIIQWHELMSCFMPFFVHISYSFHSIIYHAVQRTLVRTTQASRQSWGNKLLSFSERCSVFSIISADIIGTWSPDFPFHDPYQAALGTL